VSPSRLLAVLTLALIAIPAAAQSSDAALLAGLTSDFARLAPQTVRPAQGYIRYPYLIPAGYYEQMWDWDGFFIGLHWANQNPTDARLLRDWMLGFAASADADGYVAGSSPRRVRGRSSASSP
jgi:neutral trehalase